MATRPSLNFDGITSDTAKQIEQEYRLHKKEEKNPPKPPSAKQAPKQQAAPEFSSKDAQTILTQVDKLTQEKEKAAREAEKQQKKKNALILKYQRYYSNKVLSPLLVGCPHRKLSPDHSLAQIEYALAEVANAIAVHRSGDFVATSIVAGGEKLEKIAVSTGIADAIGLPYIEGFMKSTWAEALAEPGLMDIEREEMIIELQDWFTAPWHMRMLAITWRLAKAYNDGRAAQAKLESTKISLQNPAPAPPTAVQKPPEAPPKV